MATVRLKWRRKLQTWVAEALPIRWFEPWMRGGDCLFFSADPLVIDSDTRIKQLKLWLAQHLRRYHGHRVICMANSKAEHRMMTAAGMGRTHERRERRYHQA
jgi:hypothetical protein